ncbi:hypothetical protein GGI15_003160 [Coemansia interrupta]|uniref:Conserved oligomeric Golgi complex subunit 1 n=1 Tax=Coemansia interrupta TaxID=1126814 RepID=A0A9W8HE75_9FUNG|nr:hypothetical protein GGI15_003160 [Coemansia interrupta]
MSSWLQTRLFSRGRTAGTATPQPDAAESAAHSTDDDADDSPDSSSSGSEDSEPDAVPDDAELADVDGLFARHSVAEVRAYAQRLQRLMARERRRMRRVAAAHYPALADAADAVVRMDALSAAASLRLSRAHAMLDQAAQPAARYAPAAEPSAAAAAHDGTRDALYALAAQVKVLVDTAELVWKALAARRYVHASLVYLLAREIHGRLDASEQAAAAFPVAARVWAAVAPLGGQIAGRARQQLAAAEDAGAEASLSAVCCLALLEDVDAEVAGAEFLAHRGAALWPLLARIEAAGDAAALGRELCELLGRVRLILADYVVIFGVPAAAAEEDAAYASWAAATLAGICADAELPLHPALRVLWDDAAAAEDSSPPPPLSARRSEMQALRARRRKSSVAGAMLSAAALPAPAAAGAFNTGRPADSIAASSNVIVARHLPAAVARYCPPLVRLLDVQAPAPADALAEADEDGALPPPRLAQCLGDARVLARELAAHVQPVVARSARQSLRLWWANAARRVQDGVARAVQRRVRAVGDATRAAAELVAWEADAAAERRWARGLAWTQRVAGNALLCDVPAHALYASLVEPQLRGRARRLQHAEVERALALVDAFVAGPADVCAGHLPWQHPVADAGTLDAVARDVRGSLDFLPPGARQLRDAVDAGLAHAWDAAQAWWAQLSGAQAQAEALACAEHFAQQWAAVAARLQALASSSGEDDAACLRGAWAAVALAHVARRVLASDAAHVHAGFAQAGVTAEALVGGLQAAAGRLRLPWLRALARQTAQAWAARFDALYYRVPAGLRGDAAATRRDVVRAWRLAGGRGGAGGYAALRRLAVDPRGPRKPSPAARRVGVALCAAVQAVGGLGALARGARAAVGEALAGELSRAVALAVASPAVGVLAEWDAEQLAADARFVLCELLCVPAHAADACVSELLAALAAAEARATPPRALIGCPSS